MNQQEHSSQLSALFDNAFPMRLQVAKIGQHMGYLAHYIRQGNQQGATPIVAGVREALRES